MNLPNVSSLPDFTELLRRFSDRDRASLASLAMSVRKSEDWSVHEPRSLELIAIACAELGMTDDANELFEHLRRVDPRNPAHVGNLGVLRMQAGDLTAACTLLSEATHALPSDIGWRFNLGLALFASGAFVDAIRALETVLNLEPSNVVARLYLARALIETGDIWAAQEIALEHDFSPLQGLRELHERAHLHIGFDQPEKAEEILKVLLRLETDPAPAQIMLVGLLERANQYEQASELLAAVAGPARESSAWHLLRAKLLAHAREHDSALAELSRAESKALHDPDAVARLRPLSEIAFGRGQIHDKCGRFDDAHAAFVTANTLIRDHYRHFHPARTDAGYRIPGLEDIPALDEAIRRAGDGLNLSEAETPVFLVGFPRSGTTLLDQILDAHPRLQVLEEKPALDAVANAFRGHPEGYPRGLSGLGSADAAALRAIYWNTVRRYLTRQPQTCLVDKYPLNLARLPLALRLFPKARWIFAIRHPCDVVLSCFMQNFRFTETTHGFWSIEQTASIYAQVMELWLAQRERLRPECIDLRYEDLIGDFEGNARRLVTFLGLPWSDEVLHYREHAKRRRISTPSYNQVVQPIYKTAAGRWRHYAKHFDRAIPMLEPYVRRLGYTL